MKHEFDSNTTTLLLSCLGALTLFLLFALYGRYEEMSLEARSACVTNHPPLECEKAFP